MNNGMNNNMNNNMNNFNNNMNNNMNNYNNGLNNMNNNYNNMNNMNNMNNQGNYVPYTASRNNKLGIIIGIVLVLAIIGVAVYFIFGRSKTLKCTGKVSGVNMEVSFPVKGGKVSSGKMKVSVDLAELAKQYGVNLEDIDPNNVNLCDGYGQNSSTITVVSCKDSYSNNIATAEVEIKSKVGSEEVDEAKRDMEDDGLTCSYE